MKNKKITMFLTSLLVVSQLSLSVTVLAESKVEIKEIDTMIEDMTKEEVEMIDEEKIEEITDVKPEINVDESKEEKMMKEEENTKAFGPQTRGTTISTSEPNPLWVSLGSNGVDFQNSYYEQANVKIDGQIAGWNELVLGGTIQGEVDNISTEENKYDIKWYLMTLNDRNNISNSTTSSGNFKVNYGSSIVFGYSSQILGAYTLHKRRSSTMYPGYSISATNGDGNRDTILNSQYAGKEFYKIDYYSTLSDWNKPTKSVVAKGDDKKSDVLKKWSNVNASSNGIVRTWCAKPSYNNLYTSNGSSTRVDNYADKEGYAYYKITENGFEPLGTTPLKVVEQTISMSTTDAQLDENISDTFKDLPDTVEILGYTEYPNRSRLGKTTGKVKVAEKSSVTGNKVIESIYTVPFNVVDESLEVELLPAVLPLGTNVESLNANDYLKYVKLGDNILDESEYTASFEKAPSTVKVGNSETIIKVVTKKENKSIVEKTNTQILWGDTIGSSLDGTDKTPIDVSVSMLHDGKKPYLVANEGNGLAGDASSLSNIYVYRGSEDKAGEVFYSRQYYPKGQARETMDLWNNGGTWFNGTTQLKGFKDTEFHYGDVVAYEATDEKNPGSKTWTSKKEKLVKESIGYKKAYYEMTKDGFNLLQVNRLEVNKNIPVVSMNTSIEDMNKKAHEAMVIPDGNTGEYIFEYASVDTKTSGKKKTKLNVYETLATGGKFMTTYEVEYIVNPQVTEKYFTEKGEVLKSPVLTNFDFGTEYQVSPENFITVDGDLYIYQGWLEDSQTAGKDTPKKETPKAVKEATTFQYIYKKADNMIDMTIPTEMIFSTERESKNIVSKKQAFKNNSKDVSTEIIMTEFVSKKSDVKLLTEKDADPKKEVNEARFNLMKEEQIAIDSLNEKTKEQSIATLKSGEKTDISLAGKYFGSQDKKNHVDYQMNFKFKAHIK